MKDETGWLIEMAGPEGPKWWTGLTLIDFTENADNACRFARRQDAEHVRVMIIPEALAVKCESTEHEWIGDPEEQPDANR